MEAEVLSAGHPSQRFTLPDFMAYEPSLDVQGLKSTDYLFDLQYLTASYSIACDSLNVIYEYLYRMSHLAGEAYEEGCSDVKREILNTEFQSLKRTISRIIDGNSAEFLPEASCEGYPVLLGTLPLVTWQDGTLTVHKDVFIGNFYTGYKQSGFSGLRFLQEGEKAKTPQLRFIGTAETPLGLKLDRSAPGSSSFFNEVDCFLRAHEYLSVDSFDPESRLLILEKPHGLKRGQSTTLTVQSKWINQYLYCSSKEEVLFAEGIWGADNYRFDEVDEGFRLFVALTEEEKELRAQKITYAAYPYSLSLSEKKVRAKKNIFDLDYGTLQTRENAEAMIIQLDNSKSQVMRYLSFFEELLSGITQHYMIEVSSHEFNGDFLKGPAVLSELLGEFSADRMIKVFSGDSKL